MYTWFSRSFQALPPFVQKALLSFCLRFGGLFIQFFISVMVARLLGAEVFGAFTYAFVWATLIGTLLSLGLDPLSIREVPTFLSVRDAGSIYGFLLLLGGTIIATSLLSGLLLAVLEIRGILVLTPGWLLVTAVALSHALVLSTSRVLNGFQIIIWPQFFETFLRQIVYILLIVGLIALSYLVTPHHLFVAYLLSAIPTLLALLWLLRQTFRKNLPVSAPPTITPWLWYSASVPLLLSSFLGFFNSNIDILMIGAMLGSLDVGIYRAAARGALLVSIANTVSMQVLGPMLSRALAEQDQVSAQRFLAYGAVVSFVMALSICLLLGLGSKLFLGLFGPEFTEASTAMRLLLIGLAMNALSAGASMLLILTHRERLVLLVTVSGLFLNVTLNYFLITPFGINGAATATATTTGLISITMLMIVWRQGVFDPTLLSAIRLWRARRAIKNQG